jgi:phosphoglycolate phosphatase-like HAD superfamily hydrolase
MTSKDTSSPINKSFVLFDFDGVIADTFRQAFEAEKIFYPNLSEDLYKKRFEGNINDWEDPMNVYTDKNKQATDFFKEYIPRMEKEAVIVPKIKDVIVELEKKYFLVVISSTITSPIRNFLKKYGLANHFDEVMGNDVHQSKIEKMKMVFKRYNIESNKCVFITDTLGDMCEAEHMNVGVIGVTWGFHTPETLQKGKSFRLVEKPNDLLAAVSDYFKELEN